MLSNLRNGKYTIFRSPRMSNMQRLEAPQRYQRKDRLSLGYNTGVWMADELMCPCEGQLGSDYSLKML